MTYKSVSTGSTTRDTFSFLGQKRIAFYTDDPGEGGVAVYVHAMLCGLAKMGLDVSCIQSQADGPPQQIQRQLGVKHHWLPFQTRGDFSRTATNQRDAEQAFAATRPDVMVFANCNPFSHIAAKQSAIQLGIPFIIVEGFVRPMLNLPPEFAWCLQFAQEHYQKCKAVIAVSQENLGLLHSYFGLQKGKGEVIHYGRPEEFFQPPNAPARQSLRRELGITDEQIVCLTVARLEEVKGHACLLAAMEKLRNRPVWANLHFAWIGGGGLEGKLRESAQALGVQDQVHILGHRWDVLNWYDASDVFILPSQCEGMPLTIMEAMAKGLPVMASAVSGIPEQLGPTGRQLPPPLVNAAATAGEVATTLEAWAADPAVRRLVGQAGKARAEALFREERMVRQTLNVIERAVLPKGDYVSPGLMVVRPDRCFPNMEVANPAIQPWPYLRSEIPHNWYQDRRAPGTGFVSRDEAHILFNTALRFAGRRALEVGCWLGWSTCHLALAGVVLDVIDPALRNADFLRCVREALVAADVLARVNLVPATSPEAVQQLAEAAQACWSLIFIDGDHEGPAPVFDAAVCAEFAERDALILFHDLVAPEVAAGLDYLRRRGWNTAIYSTMQIMGVAWRGNAQPILHIPDPDVHWHIPRHLRQHKVSGK